MLFRSHPGSEPVAKLNNAAMRQWMAEDPSRSEWGTFVTAREGHVQVRRQDDSLVMIPWDKLGQEDRSFVAYRVARIRDQASQLVMLAQPARLGKNADSKDAPAMAEHFDPFVKSKAIRTRWDEKYFYVESNGIPDHPMMIGITAWQQQVPIPQKYVGENAWRIPLHPVEAKTPAMAKDR